MKRPSSKGEVDQETREGDSEGAVRRHESGRAWRIVRIAVQLVAAAILIGVGIAIARANLDYETWAKRGYAGVFAATLIGSSTLFFPAPNIPVIISGSLWLNPLLNGVVGGLGWGLGKISGFIVGFYGLSLMRRLLRDEGRRKQLERAQGVILRYGYWAVFAVALIPNPVFDAFGLAAGSLKLNPLRFLLACVMGKLICSIVISLVGHSSPFLLEQIWGSGT